MAAHDELQIQDTSGNTLMYLPGASTVSEDWRNDIVVQNMLWRNASLGQSSPALDRGGGPYALDTKRIGGEIVVQGDFVSQGDMPADYLADLRTLVISWGFPSYPAPGYPNPITAQNQKGWLLYALHNYAPLRLRHLDEMWGFNYAVSSTRLGVLPFVVYKSASFVAETSKSTIHYTVRFAIGGQV